MTEQAAEQVEQSQPATDSEGSAYARWRERRRNRVSKWDRPPDPHDWRFFVGGLGKVLIAIGLLMFGFVAYQLWGTGIETARAQNQLENEFEDLIAETSATTTEVAAPPETAASTTSPVTTPEATSTPTSEPAASIPSTSSTTTPTTAPATVDQNIPPIERGQALAKLEIPKIGKEGSNALYVLPGIDRDDLKDGPGHYPDTPLPGQLGNSAIAGHRTTFGEPFRHIDELEKGDEIIVTMFTGDRFVYEVTSTEIVDPDDYYVVTTTDPTVAELTLTSCHPVYSARQRIAVHAVLKPDESAPVGEPTYYDLEADNESEQTADESTADESTVDEPTVEESTGDESTGDESTVDGPTVDAADTGEVESSTDGTTSASEQSDDSEQAVAPSPTVPTAGVQDAFNEGWFQDRGAWPQIALWGGALILIAIGVRQISRKTRHDSIGILCGAIPFLICLYFFYQNVNRLLPPGF